MLTYMSVHHAIKFEEFFFFPPFNSKHNTSVLAGTSLRVLSPSKTNEKKKKRLRVASFLIIKCRFVVEGGFSLVLIPLETRVTNSSFSYRRIFHATLDGIFLVILAGENVQGRMISWKESFFTNWTTWPIQFK